MRNVLSIVIVALLLLSCNDDRSKAASEYCDCFRPKAKGFSSDFKKLMGKVADSNNPKKTMEKELAKLDEETQNTIREEMGTLQDIENDPTMKKCEKRIAEMKVRGKDETARLKIVVDEMKKESGCEVLTGLMALGLQQQEDGNKEDVASDEEDTEKPKKKTTTEEE